MKKIKGLLLVGCFLFTYSFAISQNAPITTIESSTACSGDTVSLDATVVDFTSIGAFGLRIEYDTTQFKYLSVTNKNGTLQSSGGIIHYESDVSGNIRKIMFAWNESSFSSQTLPDNSVLFTLNFVYKAGNPASVTFNATADFGQQCEYTDGFAIPLNDDPASTYYHDGAVSLGSTPSQPGVITGSTTICTGTSQSYNISSVSGATGYTWTVPVGWTITSGQGTTSITATAGTASGNISVTADNGCGSSTAMDLAITLNTAPLQPGTINGNMTICSSTSQTYSINSVSGATGYTWAVPVGWTITSGQGSTSITATAGTASGNVSVTADNGCGSSTAMGIAVMTTTAPSQPGVITGSTTVSAGTSQTYSIAPVSGATSYVWSYANTLLGSTDTLVTFSPTSSGQLVVRAVNSCDSSAARSLSIIITSINEGYLSGDNNSIICSPNPFNEKGIITVKSQPGSELRLALYNSTGQLLKVFADGEKVSETTHYTITGNQLPMGVYHLEVLWQNQGIVTRKFRDIVIER